jgi:AraC family transcriptional regulator
MATSDGYGQRLGERLRVENAPAIVTKTLRKAQIAVTEIRCDVPVPGMSSSFPRADAFLVGVLLRDYPAREFEDGRRIAVCDLKAGETCFYDLKRDPVILLDKPRHTLIFYLPRTALNAIADDAGVPRIDDLNYKPCAGINDATISSLGSTVLPALRHPEQANRLFVDHVMLAVGVHVAETYGGMRPVLRPLRGGLAPWQERRAKEILSADLDGDVPLKDVARECRLSVSHFSRAFRRTVGVAPHSWLVTRRIEVAKEKLRYSRLSLSDVALACGFADQSHLTRVFTGMVGVSPGAWRRTLDGRQAEEAQRSRSNAA